MVRLYTMCISICKYIKIDSLRHFESVGLAKDMYFEHSWALPIEGFNREGRERIGRTRKIEDTRDTYGWYDNHCLYTRKGDQSHQDVFSNFSGHVQQYETIQYNQFDWKLGKSSPILWCLSSFQVQRHLLNLHHSASNSSSPSFFSCASSSGVKS